MSEATLTEAQQVMVDAMTERQLQDAVVGLARSLGYLAYHTFDSRRSEAGFPDLCLVYPDVAQRGRERVVFAELKRQDGKLTTPQLTWGAALARFMLIEGSRVQYFQWRPSDWHEGTIERTLRDD